MRLDRLPGVRRAAPLLTRIRDDVVLFESWHGKYADSPRAISEELHRRGAPVEHVWAVDDPEARVPEWATVVEPGSRAYLEQVGRAGHIVANDTMPVYFRKKRGATYLQTWHGTPLKRIAFDLAPTFPGRDRYMELLRRETASWDFLVSPNAFSTAVFRKAFRYEGEILETGYPRNDLLLRPERDDVGAQTRTELGVAEGVRVVLYMPTWRDNDSFSSELELEALADALGDDHVILLRAHKQVADTVSLRGHPRVRNVSDFPDVRELYLAADVLVTDYSSAMFDFAVTGKPMLFFTYDLALYRDELRGFYFDFEAEAPGPLLSTTAEVVDALRDLDEVSGRYRDSYERFAGRFCALEDGNAAGRVVDAVFASGYANRERAPTASR